MADPESATLHTASSESDDLSIFGSDCEEGTAAEHAMEESEQEEGAVAETGAAVDAENAMEESEEEEGAVADDGAADAEQPSAAAAPALRSVVIRKRKLEEPAADEPMPPAGRADSSPLPARRARARPRRPRRRRLRRRRPADARAARPDSDARAAPDSPRAATDARSPQLARSLAEAARRTTAERVAAAFAGARADLAQPVPNGGFRAAGVSPWAAVLDFGGEQFLPEARRVTWETLMFHGRDLYRMFEVRPRAAQAARALRDLVLRGESLLDALASADECLTWCKLVAAKNLRLRTRDPIVATAGAVLENLRLKLAPFMRCYLRAHSQPPLEELCAARRLSLAVCPLSYMFVMLARLARAVRSGAESVPLREVTVGATPFEEYVPGACVAGLVDALDSHRRACDSATCQLVSSFTLVPVYMHGKYFYCNEVF
ncbi:multifunctional expression regulator [Cervid alphaherpesvirus 2]|uniref:Multifunctional expression regulator n=1 Tax=Cervid alphaherpesvirus 2 TaxID=365327 RepID=A0A455JKC2_9ALPH|nr:multifunctional expression regulator [Cervid alphaherpesvirus 2]AVT50725.1 multifunctional expression regulator [Cervid alphaherpesvirus 2]